MLTISIDDFWYSSLLAPHEGIPTLVVRLEDGADVLHHREGYAYYDAIII